MYAQLTHSIGLNDVCDALRLHSGPLSSLRGATPPTRNNLSHANKVRPAEMAEELFWAVFEHLGDQSPGFVSGQAGKRFARQVQAHDSCGGFDHHPIDRLVHGLGQASPAQSRRQVPSAAGPAKFSAALCDRGHGPRADATRAWEVCAGIKAGEIVIFDRAYVDFAHLADLSMRGCVWVTRAKENLQFPGGERYQQGRGARSCAMN